MKCPHCRTVNLEKAKFCHECGQPLISAQTLPTETTPQYIPDILAKKPSLEPTFFAGGRYQVKKLLGEGGKKKVYLVYDAVLDRDIAFAQIKTEKLDEDARTRIKREAQAMGRLGDHPNIVAVYDFGEEEGQPYMVLPLLPGGDVGELLEKAPDHRLPLDKAIRIAKAVSSGLEFAHSKGIIHRDLKPSNIWLSADGTAKIGDFGLVLAADLSRLTEFGMIVGTIAYMPPEQAMGGAITPKTNLYSFGVMLYEMVAGRRPFIGEDALAVIGQHINTPPVSPAWHRADLPPALETLIMQLLAYPIYPLQLAPSATAMSMEKLFIGSGGLSIQCCPLFECLNLVKPYEAPTTRACAKGSEYALCPLPDDFHVRPDYCIPRSSRRFQSVG